MRKATRQQLKEQNHDLVLKIFFDSGLISRAEIARMTGLTRTTVSDIVTDLIQAGLVMEVGMGKSVGGRSPILLRLVDNSRFMIGLDLAYNEFRGAIVDLRGTIHAMIGMPVVGYTGERALQATFEIVDRLVALPYRPLLGISVGAPGLVNAKEGVVKYSVNMEWRDLPLKHYLSERYRLPVIVLNDCQAAAMGEFKFSGRSPTGPNMIVVRAGQGIGAGVIIDGKIFQGDGGSAGEIGHITVMPKDALPCRCGKMGCLETVAGARALLQQATRLVETGAWTFSPNGSGGLRLEHVVRAYQENHPQVRALVDRAAYYLGVSIAGLVSTLNIQEIILVGEMTRFGPGWLEVVRKTMLDGALQQLGQGTHIQTGAFRDNDVILGASVLLAENYAVLSGNTPA